MQTTIKQYLRFPAINPGIKSDGKPFHGDPFGVMMATLDNGQIKFGWSVTHYMDDFDKKKGLMIAENRMKSFTPNSTLIVPSVMYDAMANFMDRAERQLGAKTNSDILDGFEIAVERQNKKK